MHLGILVRNERAAAVCSVGADEPKDQFSFCCQPFIVIDILCNLLCVHARPCEAAQSCVSFFTPLSLPLRGVLITFLLIIRSGRFTAPPHADARTGSIWRFLTELCVSSRSLHIDLLGEWVRFGRWALGCLDGYPLSPGRRDVGMSARQ